jgi:hypothetical protein
VRLKLVLIALSCLGAFTVGFDALRLLIGALTLARGYRPR